MTEPSPRATEIAPSLWNELSSAILKTTEIWPETASARPPLMLFSRRNSIIEAISPIIARAIASATEELRKERDALAEYLAKMQAEAIAAMMTPLGIIPSAAEQRNAALEAKVKTLRAALADAVAVIKEAKNECYPHWPFQKVLTPSGKVFDLNEANALASPLSNGPEEKEEGR